MASKRSNRSTRKNSNSFPRLLVVLLILLALVAFIFLSIRTVLKQDKSFVVKYITLDMPQEFQKDFSSCKSFLKEPILDLDLEKIASFSPTKYPYFEYVRAVRQLPDSIIIEARPRSPIARVNLNSLLDANGVVFPNKLNKDYSHLVIINGLVHSDYKPGLPLGSESFSVVKELLEKIPQTPGINFIPIKSISAANPNDISFSFESGLEVRIGSEDIDKKMFILSKIVSDVNQNIDQVKYIDLRFKDPVIGYK